MNKAAIMAVIMTCLALNAHAVSIDNVTCVTDKTEYTQGERVAIRIKNNSRDDIKITDRIYVDGGFALIEIKRIDGTWKAIELFAAANIVTWKTLRKGESHVYIWNTKGYNRSDTTAVPGVYRVTFNNGIVSNQFSVTPEKKLFH